MVAQTFNRRGSFASFSMTFDDTALIDALFRFGKDAKKEMEKVMELALSEAIFETRETLKRMADPDAEATMPFWGRGGRSRPIHARVAEALKFNKVGEMEYVVHTGKDLANKERGVEGRRGGRLAHIVAKGMDPFRYGKLPPLVASSVPYYTATGINRDSSVWMKMRVYHPGFYRTFDFIGFAQSYAIDRMEYIARERILQVAYNSGFYADMRSAESNMQGLTSVRKNIKASIGGRGIMRARG